MPVMSLMCLESNFLGFYLSRTYWKKYVKTYIFTVWEKILRCINHISNWYLKRNMKKWFFAIRLHVCAREDVLLQFILCFGFFSFIYLFLWPIRCKFQFWLSWSVYPLSCVLESLVLWHVSLNLLYWKFINPH